MSAPTPAVRPDSSELAHLLAEGDPHVWTTLRAGHIAGPDGRCSACRSAHGDAPPWPCTLRTLADQAARIVGTRNARR